jgi:hypothetical protein
LEWPDTAFLLRSLDSANRFRRQGFYVVVVCDGSDEEGDDGDALAGVGVDGGGVGGRISTGICRSSFGAASGWGVVEGAAGVCVRAVCRVVVGNALV